MKEVSIRISIFSQNLKNIKKYLVEEICQEVLTLHLLTITLRRKLNPPGFFYVLSKDNNGLEECVSNKQ